MKNLRLLPEGWPCKLIDCPPGLFVYNGQVCCKTKYGENECYTSLGETLCCDDTVEVCPVYSEWEEE